MDHEERVERLVNCCKSSIESILGDPALRSVGDACLALLEKFRGVSLEIAQAKVEMEAERLAKTAPAPCCEGAAMALVHTRDVHPQTIFGTVRIPVRTFRCARCAKHVRSDDVVLGVPESGEFTDDVRFLLAPIVAELPLRLAVELLGRATGLTMSPHGAQGAVASIARDVRREREEREAREEDEVAALRAATCEGDAETLALEVGMDGVMAHVDGDWREAKVATLQVRKVDPAATGEKRLGKVVARRYACVLAGPGELALRIQAAIREAGWQGLTVAETLGDGAPWIWNLADQLFPGVVQTLDWFHLREHFFFYASIQYSDPARAKRWVDTKMDGLLADRVGDVLGGLKRTRPRNAAARKALDDLVRYVETNQSRIRYQDAWLSGFAIGSGAVEGACKHLVQTRFKRTGMRWKTDGFLDVLDIRLARLNGSLDRFRQARRAA